MSGPIKVGDLVIVIHACCGVTGKSLGHIDKVRRIHNGLSRGCCGCGHIAGPTLAVITDPHGECGVPFSWLKRIPPMEELDDVKQDEEITA